MENNFTVRRTRADNRTKTSNDYVIAMNRNVKEQLHIGNYAAIRNLFMNDHYNEFPEWRTMVVFGKVVIDNRLNDNEVAVDQTLRNSLGMVSNLIDGKPVKIFKLERTFGQKLRGVLRPGQFLCMRVNYPSHNDMEKGLCRISSNALKLLDSNDGNSIWIECCVSGFREDIKKLFNEVIYENNAEEYRKNEHLIDSYFEGIELDKRLYVDRLQKISELKGKKDIDYIKAVAGLLLAHPDYDDFWKDHGIGRKDVQRVLNSIAAYGEWMYSKETSYRLKDQKLTAFAYDEHSESMIRDYQEKRSREREKTDEVNSAPKTEKKKKPSGNPNEPYYSMEELYPDSNRIFDMEIDLETIRLDKYYRDLLSLNVLDTVKIKRRWLESLRDDIIDYGLIFILTVFAAVAAINKDNITVLMIALPISMILTILIMHFRNK